jgi:hypothetical protein
VDVRRDGCRHEVDCDLGGRAAGRRDGGTAKAFIGDLADRLAHRVQLATDGHKVYLQAVEDAFGADIDYAMLVRTYEGDSGYTLFYNFGRIHKTLRVTPAMEAGKADHVWSLEEIVTLAN